MARKFREVFFQGAASALFACATPALAEPPVESNSLPQWVVRAQERLALQPAQQRELRALIDDNAVRMQGLQARYTADASAAARRQRLEELSGLQRTFRDELATILTPAQLAEWDALLEELLGQVHLRNGVRVADVTH